MEFPPTRAMLAICSYICVRCSYMCVAHMSESTVCPTDDCGLLWLLYVHAQFRQMPSDGLLLVVVCRSHKKQMWWGRTADNWGRRTRARAARCVLVVPQPRVTHRTQDTGVSWSSHNHRSLTGLWTKDTGQVCPQP